MVPRPDARPVQAGHLADELVLARAVDLARAGHHDAAGTLLDGTLLDGTPAALDLRARIHAQRGQLAEADACWVRATEAGGGPHHAERQLVADLQRRRFGPSRRLRRVGGGVLVLAVAALAVGATGYVLDQRHRDEALAAEVAAAHAQQDRIGDRLGAIDSRLAASGPDAQREALLSTVATDVAVPGVFVRRDGDAVTVGLDASPFGGAGTGLTPGGTAALDALGRALARHADSIVVRVVGHTDDVVGRGPGNDEIGLARALAAARELAASSGIGLGGLGLASAGANDAPFPDIGAAGQERNRTVTVEITARGR